MKYIRMKDGRIRELDFDYRTGAFTGNGYYRYKATPSDTSTLVHKNFVIAQADTIEELCDEFVIIDEDGEPNIRQGRDIDHCRRIWAINKCLIYGSIWTYKGLTYVAKMNDKGELELL